MTNTDLATCRAWCAVNGVEIRKTKWEAFAWEAFGLPDWFPKDANGYAAHFEQQAYDLIWKHVGPWLQSVRNLDVVEVEGPYQAAEYFFGCNRWHVSGNGDDVGNLSKQTARTIANLLNRECGDGK